MVDVTTAVEIARSRDEVSAYAADPDHATAWYTQITAVEWLTPRPVQVGSRMRFTARFMGRELAYTYEVVEHEPGVRFVMRTAEGPFPMETTYEWQDAGEGRTRMTLRNRGGPGGLARLMEPLAAVQVRRSTTRDLQRLRSLLER